MPNAEQLIPSSADPVKTSAPVWHPCAVCATPIGVEFETCFYCEGLPGATAAEKRASARIVAARLFSRSGT